jgi:hypothetical protein
MSAKVGQSQLGPSVVRPFDTRRPAASSRTVLPRGQRQLVEQSLLRYLRRDGKPRS